jgi:hypothetical protein
MSEKVRALKKKIQMAAVEAAREFHVLELEETGHGRCGSCPACLESMENLAALFFKAMERELSVLHRDASGSGLEAFDAFVAASRLN